MVSCLFMMKKHFKRLVLDCLTRLPLLGTIIFFTFICIFNIGYWCAHWIDRVDLVRYNPYNAFFDNIGGASILSLMPDILPIDVVYTWVNGSDPVLLENMKKESANSGEDQMLFPSKYYSIRWDDTLSALEKFTHLEVVEKFQLFSENESVNLYIVRSSNGNNSIDLDNEYKSIRAKPAFWTLNGKTNWTVEWKSATFVKIEKNKNLHEQLSDILLTSYNNFIEHCLISTKDQISIIDCVDEKYIRALNDSFVEFKRKGDEKMIIYPAYLIPSLEYSKSNIINRFQDYEELRYSLRSLEKYCPWVRRIYLVTNGQIPYWLNLDHPRLSIVTHEEIFSDTSHLPTFSSSAIESHIHRIPDLSEHFLYLNDDVFFGATVWPQDFYSISDGYKVYLSWSLPDCASGCPSSWILDGFCDLNCNTSSCSWDGGDCLTDKDGKLRGKIINMDSSDGDGGDNGGWDIHDDDFCSPGCSSLWLIDGFCDTNCNTPSCGFDMGDCGYDSIKYHLHEIPFENKSNFTVNLSKGVSNGWMDLSGIISSQPNISVEGSFKPLNNVYSSTIDKIQKIMIIILKENATGVVNIEIKISKNTTEENQENGQKVFITINFDSRSVKKLANNLLKIQSNVSQVPIHNVSHERVSPELFQLNYIHDKNVGKSNALKLNANATDNASLNNNTINAEPRIKLTKSEGQHDNINGKISLVNKLKREDVKRNNLEHFPVLKNINRNNKNIKVSRSVLSFQEYLLDNNESNETYMHGKLNAEKKSNKSHEEKSDDWLITDSKNILDAFGNSLVHVNKLYNSEYGVVTKKVPAHMPHLINKNIMTDLQNKFSYEFNLTSSHKFRHSNDMMYSFSYFYYLMSEKVNKSREVLFDEYDTDESGTWSDREMRTLITHTHDLPIYYKYIQELHDVIRNCSIGYKSLPISTLLDERYADSNLPTVTKDLILNCNHTYLNNIFKQLEKTPKYKFTLESDTKVHFKMISSNVSFVVSSLDDIRKHPRKFICLNNNLDSSRVQDNELVYALVQDLLESILPKSSSFELPLNYRNRFLTTAELKNWRTWRNFVRALIYACLGSLILLTLAAFFGKEIEYLRRRFCKRRRRKAELLIPRV